MTNLTLEEAEKECADALKQTDEARLDYEAAKTELENARSKLEGERSLWDESSFYSVGGAAFIVGGILACLIPEPTTKLVCAGGIASIAGGAAGIAGSEIDRAKDIEAAEAAVEAAELNVDKTFENLNEAGLQSFKCVSHHVLKVKPLRR